VTDRLTESDIEGMIKAYLSGSTIARLAEQHGEASPAGVRRAEASAERRGMRSGELLIKASQSIRTAERDP
jgi:hypothetical protein